jgi:Leucine-rich repeat (LRR) protein
MITKIEMKFCAVFATLVLLLLVPIKAEYSTENEEKTFDHLCNFEKPMINDGDEFCNCDVVKSPMVGKPAVKIDCMLSDGVTNLTIETFKAEKLPTYTISLILSFQSFEEIPQFVGDSLIELDMSNNRIKVIKDSNFVTVNKLEVLDLSYNLIFGIENNAFAQLTRLQQLDLSNNRLVNSFPTLTFAPLQALNVLKLSGNEGFGRVQGKDKPNSSLIDLYLQLGLRKALKTLEIERCNLTRINLVAGTGLESLNLGFNSFTNFSLISIPSQIKKLELSGNPFEEFTAHSLSHFYLLEELFMEDLPFLGEVCEYSLFGMPKLRHISFEGSKNLSHFDEFAFGKNVVANETDLELKVLNLRGCNLRTLNESMSMVFDGLKELHLEGNPFNCDCKMQFVKDLEMETGAICYRPDEHKNKLLSEVEELKCPFMSSFVRKIVNSLILVILLIACSLAIWCFLKQLNPKHRKKHSIGPQSPYHRVTIEPNRAEYSLY